MDPPKATSGERVSRRQVLRLIAFSAFGAGVILATGKLAGAAFPTTAAGGDGGSSAATSSATPTAVLHEASASTLSVKVMYFQMPQTISTKEEHFVLQSPAHFRDLLSGVLQKHPSLSPMMPSMMVLIDGVRAQPDATLRDGDEVDFIPAVAGG